MQRYDFFLTWQYNNCSEGDVNNAKRMDMIREETVFGPIFSRRLGSSLGINLLPEKGKICNFDCIYCECGWNRDGRNDTVLPTAEKVRTDLERMLKTAKVISEESRDDEVGLNNTVTVYFEEDDEEEVYKLVTTVRGNSMKNLITIESPLGKALMGHRVGDRVHIQVNPDYGYEVEIRKIENTQDDGTDAIRKF